MLQYFRGLSFPTISSVGPNAAIIHYAPNSETCAEFDPDEIYLFDSGAQVRQRGPCLISHKRKLLPIVWIVTITNLFNKCPILFFTVLIIFMLLFCCLIIWMAYLKYLDGTTDITRTVHFGKPSEHEKACYTAVSVFHCFPWRYFVHS